MLSATTSTRGVPFSLRVTQQANPAVRRSRLNICWWAWFAKQVPSLPVLLHPYRLKNSGREFRGRSPLTVRTCGTTFPLRRNASESWVIRLRIQRPGSSPYRRRTSSIGNSPGETCLAARMLTEMGLQIEHLRQRLATGVLQNVGFDSTGSIPAAGGRGAIHALIDKVPDEMLVQVKETVDRMLWRSQREKPFRNVEGMVVRGTFSSNPDEKQKDATEPQQVNPESSQ